MPIAYFHFPKILLSSVSPARNGMLGCHLVARRLGDMVGRTNVLNASSIAAVA
ncbi:MAG TPA: hypothetical protein VNN08_23600 [Thermoanaerobaculia bacterium]|nr:hypothetical protein [Thermoanaerobaculia bacterium]